MTTWQSRLPLRVRLSLITAALLLVASSLLSVVSLALLQRSLKAELDDQLLGAAQPLVQRAADFLAQQRQSLSDLDNDLLPSDYYVRILHLDGSTWGSVSSASTDASPSVPALPLDEVEAITGEPFTVTSDGGSPRWRVVMYPLDDRSGDIVFTAAIAIPMTAVDGTLHQMRIAMMLIGLGVVVIGAIGGYLAVERSLLGLRDIESTAAAVAAGDLSRRAPTAPTTTEVGRLGASFNAMVANLEAAFAARAASEERMRRFVSDASHELRTPLSSIRGYGELYRMGAVPPDQVPATMSRIENEAIRMGTLVGDLLALARLDEGQQMRFAPVDLTTIAGDAVGDLRALDPGRPVELVATGPVWVDGDSDRLRQVVTNLIGNVAQHTPPGTPVELVTRVDGDAGVIEVRDHGPGIPPQDAERIFERFYRPDTSRARTSGGSGLGLAIVATIVAAHGGTVRHHPTAGGGATMVVRLPLRQHAAAPAPAR